MAGPKQLSIGTPRELADCGALSAFIEQRGIVFDRERLSVRVVPVT
jgi:iron complex transport system ATP-binding protein